MGEEYEYSNQNALDGQVFGVWKNVDPEGGEFGIKFGYLNNNFYNTILYSHFSFD